MAGRPELMGLFISFEGIEGCGKTTQIQLLAKFLESRGLACILTREPGGTAVGEAIREIFLRSSNTALIPLTELLLVTAARVQHIHEVIIPGLAAGKIVLCDRFFDATAVYQGYAGGAPLELIQRSHELFCGALTPDLTLLLDCPLDVGISRSRARNRAAGLELAEGRFEDKDMAFHGKVRQGYLACADGDPGRFHIIYAGETIQAIHENIAGCVTAKLREKGYAV
jgi:dTMP kinase